MPSATGKGKIPCDQVKEYDPNLQGALGHGREKYQKRYAGSKGGGKRKMPTYKHTVS